MRLRPWMDWQIFAPCNICTPTIHGGRIPQRARKAVRLCLWLSLLTIMLPSILLAAAEDKKNYNPFETRDQNLFNLIHGQPLPTNANLNKKSQGLWSTSLAITNTTNIKSSNNEDIYLDYESYRFNFSYQYGLSDDWSLKLDIPLIRQSGGVFDSAIESWHNIFGLPKGQRSIIEQNQYNISYIEQGTPQINLDTASTTLGDIQIATAHSLIDTGSTTMSLWGSLKLPTGDKNKLSGNGAVDVSAWLALNQRLAKRWRANLNAGAVLPGKNEYNNIPLSDYALFGHVMLSWLITDAINIKAQLQGHSSYYDQSQLKILGSTYFLTVGAAINISQCQQLDIAISEDIYIEASPDVSLLINWRSYSGC